MKIWHRLGLVVLLAGIGTGWLVWRARSESNMRFLPGDARAEWILFPTAIGPLAYPVVDLDTTFRREFELPAQPREARLDFRASKRVEIQINGTPVVLPKQENWKVVSTVDVLPFVRAGANVIEARVINNNAPPSLWARLTADESILRTDGTWQASLVGSAWRGTVRATDLRLPGPGNLIAGGERLSEALPRIWRTWFIVAASVIVVYLLANRLFPGMAGIKLSGRQAVIPLVVLALLWGILFWNNATLISRDAGFDAKAHLAYIQYVLERRALPSPTEGFVMFHPPLYYMISAAALSMTGTSPTEMSGLGVLRMLTMLFGIAHFSAVFFALRLLFPGRLGPPLVGVGFAAFVPMQLCLAHYVTNETLAATLVSVAIYLALRLLLQPSVSALGYMSLGLVLGAAMLTKVTAILLVPPLFIALGARNLIQRTSAKGWLQTTGTMVAAFCVVCGWHYIRTWMRFGTPFLSGSGRIAWWQDPGYRTLADYTRFGRSLWDPFYSSLFRFWDGIYSTVWGDGLWGGAPNLVQRTPWNYDLMTGGYVLALVPAALIVIGAVSAVYYFLRRPSAEVFLLVSFAGALLAALVSLSLNAAAYSAVKGFYGLPALVPLSFFAALGWNLVTRSRPILQGVLTCLLLIWAVNGFVSVWIRDSAARRTYAALQLRADKKLEAAVSELSRAVDADPADVTSLRFLASFLDEGGLSSEALEQARLAVNLRPDEGANHAHLAAILARRGQTAEAIAAALRAQELAPEDPFVYEALVALLLQVQRSREAVDLGREGLRVTPFSPGLHQALAEAYVREQDAVGAARHAEYARALMALPNPK